MARLAILFFGHDGYHDHLHRQVAEGSHQRRLDRLQAPHVGFCVRVPTARYKHGIVPDRGSWTGSPTWNHQTPSQLSRITHLRLFVNTVKDGRKWSNKLGNLIVVADLDIFVLEINDEIDKHKKFVVARLFTNAARLAGLSPHVLVGTRLPTTASTSLTQIWCVARGPLAVSPPRCKRGVVTAGNPGCLASTMFTLAGGR